MIEASFAPPISAFARRAGPLPAMPTVTIAPSPSLVQDIRLFAATWAIGFVFFLAFLA